VLLKIILHKGNNINTLVVGAEKILFPLRYRLLTDFIQQRYYKERAK